MYTVERVAVVRAENTCKMAVLLRVLAIIETYKI